jgi:hypothetical protein
VTRYPHVAPAELHAPAQAIAAHTTVSPAGETVSHSSTAGMVQGAAWSDAGKPSSESRAPVPSDPIEIATTREPTLTPRIPGD